MAADAVRACAGVVPWAVDPCAVPCAGVFCPETAATRLAEMVGTVPAAREDWIGSAATSAGGVRSFGVALSEARMEAEEGAGVGV